MRYLNIIIMAIIFIGCSSSEESTNDTISKGVFLDSPVQGLKYKTNSITGVTNEKGEYQYRAGENISFYINDLLIGTQVASNLVTPSLLNNEFYSDDVNSFSDRTNNLLILLQSLDSDANPDNGINIEDINTSFSDLDLANHSDVLIKIQEANSSGNLSIVDLQSAKNHFKNSLDNLSNDKFYYYDYIYDEPSDTLTFLDLEFSIVNNNISGVLYDDSEAYYVSGNYDNGNINILSESKTFQYTFELTNQSFYIEGYVKRSDIGYYVDSSAEKEKIYLYK